MEFDLNKRLQEVDFIVLSPGISLKKTKHRKKLINLKKKDYYRHRLVIFE